MDIFPDIVLIDPTMPDQLPPKPQRQCSVCTGLYPQVQVGTLGGRSDPGIDDNDLHAPAVVGLKAPVHQIRGDARVGAKAQKYPCVAQIRLYHLRTRGALP